MMDFGSFREHGPWSWFLSDAIVGTALLGDLMRHFPEELLILSERKEGSDKTYLCKQFRLYSDYAENAGDARFHPVWDDFVGYVRSEQYRLAVSEMTALDLRQAGLEVILNQYEKDCFMSAHTDRRPKLVTHVIYLSGDKGAGLGGEFIVHGADATPVHCVEPWAGRSVLFKRSDASLHSVNAIKAVHKRRSLQIVFWESEPATTAPGRKIHRT